jgi:hypothetical protein
MGVNRIKAHYIICMCGNTIMKVPMLYKEYVLIKNGKNPLSNIALLNQSLCFTKKGCLQCGFNNHDSFCLYFYPLRNVQTQV